MWAAAPGGRDDQPIAALCWIEAIRVSNAQPGVARVRGPQTDSLWGLMSSRQHARRTDDSSFVATRITIESLLIYDTREHEWVQDSRYPDKLPISMYGQCTAFLDNTLVVVAGGTNDEARPWGFSWDEQLRMWQSLPPVPTAVAHPGYGIIGSRLFLVGGYSTTELMPSIMVGDGPGPLFSAPPDLRHDNANLVSRAASGCAQGQNGLNQQLGCSCEQRALCVFANV